MVARLPGRTHGLGLITEPLLADLGVDRVAYAVVNFWATLIGAAFCLPAGWALDRLGIRGVLAAVLLGLGAVVGDEVWDQQSIVRIRIGPLSLERYLEFLPTGAAHKPLQSLVRLYSGDEKDFEVLLMLKRDETPSAELGGLGMTAPQLGWVTWMKSVPIGRDPADVIISL